MPKVTIDALGEGSFIDVPLIYSVDLFAFKV